VNELFGHLKIICRALRRSFHIATLAPQTTRAPPDVRTAILSGEMVQTRNAILLSHYRAAGKSKNGNPD
jgi:hypothetical protein